MKKIVLLFTAVLLLISCSIQANTIELFVSVNGIKNSKGSKSKPFLTIEEAIKRATELKEKDTSLSIVINILPGAYYLTKSIQIPSILNGLQIKGTDASEVHIKGSIPLKANWKKYNSTMYVTKVPKDLNFDQLIVNGKAQILARYPNYNEEGHYWQGVRGRCYF
ncbi:hypothetical protein M601_019875 [Cellulophaga baltica 4]|nr:hypothetical protein M601_019875 [Cellulophaga baltica 4]